MALPAHTVPSGQEALPHSAGLFEDLSLVAGYCSELCDELPDDLSASSVVSHLLRDLCEAIDRCVRSERHPAPELISRALFGLSAAAQVYFDAARAYRERAKNEGDPERDAGGVEQATAYSYRASSAGELAARLIHSEWIFSRAPSEESPSRERLNSKP